MSDFNQYVLELVSPIGPVTVRRMFGGAGLFMDDTMFALVANDVLYLKVDDKNQGLFEAAGMAPFTYQRGTKTVALSYFEAPDEAMEDAETMRPWALSAWEAARRSKLNL